MNRKILYMALVAITLFSFNCNKQDQFQPLNKENIVGFWINPQYNDSLIVFNRADQLVKDKYGLSIKNNYELTERKNIGWCGTPPIVYGDYSGNWSKVGDELTINVGFWGGIATLKWQILAVTDQNLQVKLLEQKFVE